MSACTGTEAQQHGGTDTDVQTGRQAERGTDADIGSGDRGSDRDVCRGEDRGRGTGRDLSRQARGTDTDAGADNQPMPRVIHLRDGISGAKQTRNGAGKSIPASACAVRARRSCARGEEDGEGRKGKGGEDF